jgi:kynureninase
LIKLGPIGFMQDSAIQLDQADSLSSLRGEFVIPQYEGQPEIYFVGNSLGLMPRCVEEYVEQVFHQWKTLGVRGHFKATNLGDLTPSG